jgi:hypothetical protein
MINTELKIKGSKTMPNVTFINGTLNIVGRSVLNNSSIWCEPVLKALSEQSSYSQTTRINIHLDYLNSDSNRALLNLLMVAEKLHNMGKKVEIHWLYANNDMGMLEQGSIFKELIKVPFKFEPVN